MKQETYPAAEVTESAPRPPKVEHYTQLLYLSLVVDVSFHLARFIGICGGLAILWGINFYGGIHFNDPWIFYSILILIGPLAILRKRVNGRLEVERRHLEIDNQEEER